MKRRILVGASLVLALLLVLGFVFPIFNYIQIVAPIMEVYVKVTRNGQELPAGQIRGVRYCFLLNNVTQYPTLVPNRALRDGRELAGTGCFVIGASISIYKYHPGNRIEIKPEFHSVFVQVLFVDGKSISTWYPIAPDRRESFIAIDLADGPDLSPLPFPAP